VAGSGPQDLDLKSVTQHDEDGARLSQVTKDAASLADALAFRFKWRDYAVDSEGFLHSPGSLTLNPRTRKGLKRQTSVLLLHGEKLIVGESSDQPSVALPDKLKPARPNIKPSRCAAKVA
jgi:hypothetical protein